MIKYIFLFILIISCSAKNNSVTVKADNFIKYYSSHFLENKALFNYSYNKRTQFYFRESADNEFRIMTSEKSLKFFCFSDSCLLDKKLGIKSLKYLKKGFYEIRNDTIKLHFDKDSIIDSTIKLDKDPLLIFENYKTELNRLGIYSYSAKPSINRYYVHLDSKYVLIKSNEIEKLISGKDKIIKNYKDNWSLVKRASANEF